MKWCTDSGNFYCIKEPNGNAAIVILKQLTYSQPEMQYKDSLIVELAKQLDILQALAHDLLEDIESYQELNNLGGRDNQSQAQLRRFLNKHKLG